MRNRDDDKPQMLSLSHAEMQARARYVARFGAAAVRQAIAVELANRDAAYEQRDRLVAAGDGDGSPVSVRQAQAAAMQLGDVQTEKIVGPGGLSGASAEQLRLLVNEATAEWWNVEALGHDWFAATLKNVLAEME